MRTEDILLEGEAAAFCRCFQPAPRHVPIGWRRSRDGLRLLTSEAQAHPSHAPCQPSHARG